MILKYLKYGNVEIESDLVEPELLLRNLCSFQLLLCTYDIGQDQYAG